MQVASRGKELQLTVLRTCSTSGSGCAQDADGELTEANFGNDDETMGRLQDMGVPGGNQVQADVSRQNDGAAQRRRQATRVNAADIRLDEDDQFGSMALEPDNERDSEPEDGELPIQGTLCLCEKQLRYSRAAPGTAC